jgi:hypothetical protein
MVDHCPPTLTSSVLEQMTDALIFWGSRCLSSSFSSCPRLDARAWRRRCTVGDPSPGLSSFGPFQHLVIRLSQGRTGVSEHQTQNRAASEVHIDCLHFRPHGHVCTYLISHLLREREGGKGEAGVLPRTCKSNVGEKPMTITVGQVFKFRPHNLPQTSQTWKEKVLTTVRPEGRFN